MFCTTDITDFIQPTTANIVVVGDFCVDVYWELSPPDGEISIETGLPVCKVNRARYSPGGAGNVVANLLALGCEKVIGIGLVGEDPFGGFLRSQRGCESLITSNQTEFHTPVYCKPMRDGNEQPRIDIGNRLSPSETDIERVFNALKFALATGGVLIINQQLRNGLHSKPFRERLAKFVSENSARIPMFYDGRDYQDAYSGAILKINASEASMLAFANPDRPPEKSGEKLYNQTNTPLVITDGANGAYVFDSPTARKIPAVPTPPPLDTVGAGDSFLAGMALATANNATLVDAAFVGSLCAAVTVKKIGVTGTATTAEILSVLSGLNR